MAVHAVCWWRLRREIWLLSFLLLFYLPQGFVSLGFPLAPGRMVPADAVLGRLDNATGAVKVSSSSSSNEDGSSTRSSSRIHS